ncbi:uncharacterized protein [Branchiostoma lanceolatum]|uniref:uncharacterized protein isoform X1 n=1 Tax=Branchiostoma lanceolatum TaxID=7740 RepID=UPI003452E0DD
MQTVVEPESRVVVPVNFNMPEMYHWDFQPVERAKVKYADSCRLHHDVHVPAFEKYLETRKRPQDNYARKWPQSSDEKLSKPRYMETFARKLLEKHAQRQPIRYMYRDKNAERRQEHEAQVKVRVGKETVVHRNGVPRLRMAHGTVSTSSSLPSNNLNIIQGTAIGCTTSPSSNHFNREDLSPQRVDRNLSTSTTSSHDFRPLEEREDRPIGSQYGIPRIDQDRALRADEIKSKDGTKWNAFKPTWERNAGIHSSSYILRETVPTPHTQINGISLSRNSNTGLGLGRGDELPLALGALSLSSPVRRRESSPKAPPKWKLESKTSLSAPAGQRSKYPDPVSGAPSNFQQRLAELSVLEQDTIRYERTKKSKRKAKQDRDS